MKGEGEKHESTLNEIWTMKTWALIALLISIVCLSLGIAMLILSYSGELMHPEIIGGWIVTSLGVALYCASCFGTKSPKDLRKEAKQKGEAK